MEWMVKANEPGKTYLLQGNEAIVRELWKPVFALQPLIRDHLLRNHGYARRVAGEMDIYAEWSTNENCAFQACMGASMGQVRSLCVVKQNGLLTIGDALHTAALSGCKGGVVLLAATTLMLIPVPMSLTPPSSPAAGIPMLEPATFQEAKDMMVYAFELSEKLQQ